MSSNQSSLLTSILSLLMSRNLKNLQSIQIMRIMWTILTLMGIKLWLFMKLWSKTNTLLKPKRSLLLGPSNGINELLSPFKLFKLKSNVKWKQLVLKIAMINPSFFLNIYLKLRIIEGSSCPFFSNRWTLFFSWQFFLNQESWFILLFIWRVRLAFYYKRPKITSSACLLSY